MTNTLVLTVQNGFIDPNANMSQATTNLTTADLVIGQQGAALAPVADNNDFAPIDPVEFESIMSLYALLYVFLGILVYISSLIQITCWQVTCERQTHRIRKNFFKSVLRQEISWFDLHQSGDLATKLNDDIERIHDGMGEQFSLLVKYFASFLSGFVVGFIVSWRLTLTILGCTPLLAFFSAWLGKIMATSTKREQEKYAKAGAIAEEILVAIRTVFALNGQRYELKRFSEKLNEGRVLADSKYLKISFLVGGNMLVLYSAYGLALWVGVKLLAVDKLDAGSAMAVLMAVMMGASALGNIIPPLQTIVMATSSATLIYEIIDSIPRVDASTERGLKLAKVTANIKFDNVNFSYPSRKTVPVMKNLNLEINQGQTVAICGKTGSGKSTVMNLLLRFYDPDSGAIYLDQCNLCDLNVAWLRSLIGIVEQEPALFDCSIFDNIALGVSQEADRTYDRIIKAAKLANAHDFIINLPDGYNTRCGDRGHQMSGGQKQRIAISRALLGDPKILLMDEATSALDSESEAMVQSALNRARQGRTTIVIAHRLSTIRDADLICVMDQGEIVEMGRHDDLMAAKQHYYGLVTNQVFEEDKEKENLENQDADDTDEKLSLSISAKQQLDSRSRSSSPMKSLHTQKKISISLYESIQRPSKEDEEEENVVAPQTKDILRLIRPELVLLMFGVFASLLSGAVMPVFALFYAQIFDTFTKTGDELLAAGSFWAIMFVVLGATTFVIMFFRLFLIAHAIELMTERLRNESFTVMLRQHVGWYDNERHSPQRLTTRLASDIPQIKSIINSRLVTLISAMATVAASLIISFYIGWKLAFLLTAALPLLIYVGYVQMSMQRGKKVENTERMEDASRLATECVEHVKLIQAIGQEKHFISKFEECLSGPYKESVSAARRFGLVYGLSQSAIYFVYGAAFRYGAFLMARQEMQPIDVFRVFFSIAFTAVAVGQWGAFSGDINRANYAVGMIIRLLQSHSSIDNLSRGGTKPAFKGSVTFQNLFFRYPTRPELPVLQNLTLNIKSGQTVALVGASGCGKSTLAQLLLRFYDPDKGVIKIDQYDIRCVNINHLRQNVGIVSQEPVLFRASIRENIAYGLMERQYSFNDVVEAAKLANIHDFIESLPEGYNTQVGERGVQMSGGQKQRIAIARTMIRKPVILILDEATSALDTESEALVNQALEAAGKGRTCIKIAHRLSTVRDSDQIAVIERGRIAEIGTHEQLMALGNKGFYFRLMQSQDFTR